MKGLAHYPIGSRLQKLKIHRRLQRIFDSSIYIFCARVRKRKAQDSDGQKSDSIYSTTWLRLNYPKSLGITTG